MPAALRNSHNVRHAVAGRISRVAAPPAPDIEAQCRAVVARLNEITAPGDGGTDDDNGTGVDVRALACLPDPSRWGGRAIVPWGHPSARGKLSGEIEPIRAGRSGWYLQYDDAIYDTVRDVFVAARLDRPVSTPWTSGGHGHGCGCLTRAASRDVTIEGKIDVEAQLELMRGTLRHVALTAPRVDLGILADDLFAGQRVLAEHYLWRLETDGFVDHAGEERQDSLMLTAEGCSTMLMLELTRPGVNSADADLMSPRALAQAAETEVADREQRGSHLEPNELHLDIPRFLTNREPRSSQDRITGSTTAQQNTQRGSHNGRA